jgi:hypothetical protein
MAIVIIGSSPCALCDEVLEDEHELVMTSPFIEDTSSDLGRYSDASFHKNCFMAWESRERLIRTFNEYYKRHYRGMRVIDDEGTISDV